MVNDSLKKLYLLVSILQWVHFAAKFSTIDNDQLSMIVDLAPQIIKSGLRYGPEPRQNRPFWSQNATPAKIRH
jgi:hypothetical protein